MGCSETPRSSDIECVTASRFPSGETATSSGYASPSVISCRSSSRGPVAEPVASGMEAVHAEVPPVEVDHGEVMPPKPRDARARREPLPTRDRERFEAGDVRVVQHRALGHVRQDQAGQAGSRTGRRHHARWNGTVVECCSLVHRHTPSLRRLSHIEHARGPAFGGALILPYPGTSRSGRRPVGQPHSIGRRSAPAHSE